MAHRSHKTSPQHSGNSAPGRAYQGDRDPKATVSGPSNPPDAQVIPPTGDRGCGDEDGKP